MTTLKPAHSLLFAILMAAAILGTVMTNVQTVFAPRGCGGCVEFKKLTHEFEKSVIAALEDPENIPEALNAYSQVVQRIFIGDPGIDQVRTLLQGYKQDLTTIFEQNPPEPDKPHDQIKEFKQLTKDLEGAIAGVVIAATQDN